MLHVIGIGSPFGDDRIGWRLIEEMRRSERLQPYLGCELELHHSDRPGAALLAQLEGVENAVIIDAVVTGGVVGQLHCWSDVAMVEESCSSCSTHGFGLAQTLILGRVLGGLPPQLLVLGVEIAPPDSSADLSVQLQQQLPVLVPQLINEIADCLEPK